MRDTEVAGCRAGGYEGPSGGGAAGQEEAGDERRALQCPESGLLTQGVLTFSTTIQIYTVY